MMHSQTQIKFKNQVSMELIWKRGSKFDDGKLYSYILFLNKWVSISEQMSFYFWTNEFLFLNKWVSISEQMSFYFLTNEFLFLNKWVSIS